MGSWRTAVAAACVVLAVALALGASSAGAAAAPAVSSLGGSLVGASTVSGRATIYLDVSDPAGVASVALVVDTTTVELDNSPGLTSALLDDDTTTLRDGLHQFAVVVTDGDGVTTTAWQELITTFNAPLGGEPQVNGDDEVGQTLVAADGSWSPAPARYEYQWLRCEQGGLGCAPIAGAMSPSYTLVAGDAYDVLEVAVTATDTGGSTTATSAPSSPIADADGNLAPPPAPSLAAGEAPQISGATAQGQTLSAQPGNWSGGPLSFAYQWQRCNGAGGGCAAIAGASGATYTLGAADAGTTVRVLVSATGPGGTSSAQSAATGAVGGESSTAPSPAAASAANGTHACAPATLHARLGSGASVTVPLGRTATLRGSLRCGPAPIGGASVAVVVVPLAGGGPTRRATVRTSADGAFDYVLGSGASRRITLSYRAWADAASPAAQASATMLVRPSIALAITPAATTNGHTIAFAGAVAGGHEPAGGLTLDIEYREGGAWMIYTTVRTGPGGAFRWRYTFHRTTESITYWFRVAIPTSGVIGYPFQPTASPARSVHVRP